MAGAGAGHRSAATAIAVAAWGLAAVTGVTLLAGRPEVDESFWFLLVDLTVCCVYGTVAHVTLSRRAHPVPWLLAVAAIGGGLSAFGFAYSVWAPQPGGLPPVAAVADLQSQGWVPGTFALFLVVPWLVRNHPLGPERWGLVVGVLLTVVITVATFRRADLYFTRFVTASIFVGLATALVVELRRRYGPEDERNGLGWLALGTSILALSFIPVVLPYDGVPIWTTPVLHLASQAVFPAAVLVVVLRNRMWGLGLAVSRAVLAGLLTAGLVGLYLLVTIVLHGFLPGDGVPQLISAAVVTVAVQPARLLLQRRVHHLVYGDAADRGRVVRRLGSQLVGSSTVEELLSGLTEDIGRSMRLESVAVVAPGVDPVRWGAPSEEPVHLPLQHRGQDVGTLSVSPQPGESLSARDLETLRDLSSVVGAAVAVARAAGDVEDMRGRLARVRLEERRVIRREIHDGLGPSLAGIRLGLQGARNLLDTDLEEGKVLLRHLQGEIDAAVAGVRSLSHHLLPPVLDELGLGAALEELGQRYDVTDLVVRVDTDGFADLDPRLAAAAYGIVSEATTNAARHAGASTCWISAHATSEAIVLAVADDGIGLAGDEVTGVGTRSMRERAAEQDGTLEISTRDAGGTVVRAVLPRSVTHD
ncbi:MAG: two component system sensor kinase [Nocardioides sp.]|nr:two component system sensor kinase [Nocardioides sp.]